MVMLNEELKAFVEPVKEFKKRQCFTELQDYVYGNSTDRVFILYGDGVKIGLNQEKPSK